HGGDVVDRGGGKDSVAEVEDVSSDRGATLQHLGGGGDDRVWISEEDRRVEIALHRVLAAEASPRLVDRKPPIDPVGGRADLRHRFEQMRAGWSEVDGRHVEVDERLPGGWHDVAAEHIDRNQPCPAVEQLD